MNERPTRLAIGARASPLWSRPRSSPLLSDGWSDWDLPLLATLTALSIVSDLIAIETRVTRVLVSASLMTIVIGAVLLGGAPGGADGRGHDPRRLGSSTATRASDLLINLVTYAWFPLIAGIVFHAIADANGIELGDLGFYLLIVGVFVVALAIDFILIAGYSCYVERSSFASQGPARPRSPCSRRSSPRRCWRSASPRAYVQVGTAAVALLSVVILVFQYLVGALLVSQDRADELELRARQLAGFQVALLSALLRTLDLRDRMTARHSAAVARYSREIAAQVGISAEDQELVHSAGAAARHRQVRAPRQHPQVRPAQAHRRGVGGDQDPPRTRARGSSPRSTATSRSARSSSPTTSASTARATRAGSPTTRSPSSRRSSRSPTPTT